MPPSAEIVLERAVECAKRAAGASVLAQYTGEHTNRTLELDRSGRVSNERVDKYRIRTVDGEPFYELVERNGEPATQRDLRKEAERRAKFRESFESESDLAHETSLGFALTYAILERYDFELTGRHPVDGWAIEFTPKPGELPVRKRIDQVLNRLEGTLWIDEEDFGLTRAEFALRRPLKIWAGLLGSLTRFEGRFEQVRLAPGHWLPRALRLEMDGWAPFHSLRKRVELDWREYRPAGSRD